MKNIDEAFEDSYQKWKSFIQSDAVALSSRDEDYVNNPHFQAIVNLGKEAVPYIIQKLQTDESAHFLIHALESITQHQFTPAEVAAAQARSGAPLGNQGYAAMWQDWWNKQSSGEPEG